MDVKESGYSWMRKAVTRLTTYTIADATLDAPTTYSIYTVPRGKRLIFNHASWHSNSATLAGMTDVDIGVNGGSQLVSAQSLASMTSANVGLISWPAAVTITVDGDDATVANRTVTVTVNAGSTGAASVKIDLFGYLISS